jgi:hypothetical protein
MNGIEWGSVALWVNTLVATFGLGGILYQVNRQRQLNSANLLLSLEAKYGEPGMIRARKEFAEIVRVNLNSEKNALTGYQPVLSFFDMLGALVHRGVLDEQLIWHRFNWRVIRCWLAIATNVNLMQKNQPAAGSLLERLRRTEREPHIYDQFEWLAKRFVQRDVTLHRHGNGHSEQQIYEMVMQYYDQESALV